LCVFYIHRPPVPSPGFQAMILTAVMRCKPVVCLTGFRLVCYNLAMLIIRILICLLVAVVPVLAANSERNFGGVGIDGAALADGQIKVRQVVAGGPAHLAGVHVGDVITHIDSKATRGSNFQQMVHKRLRGVAGTPVVIKVHRQGSDKPLSFTLVRRQMIVGSGR